MPTKSQSAIEFMILTGFVLFGFAVFLLTIQGSMSDEIRENRNLMLKETATSVQDEISIASKTSDGYSRTFSVPQKISNMGYSIEILNQSIYIRTLDNKNALSLPIPKVKGNVILGENTIRKENGTVYLN